MNKHIPLRCCFGDSAERLTDLLGLSPFDEMYQDWPLEVSDSSRVREFCDAYEADALKLSSEEAFGLMQLILYSLDEWMGENHLSADADSSTERLPDRMDRLLRRDFLLHLHTVDYWRLPDETDPENIFPITPLMRTIWEDCYRPEYSGWLEDV